MDFIQKSLELAQQLEVPIELGVSKRVYGQILLACNQRLEAYEAFAQSLSLLADQGSYEVARAKMHFGLALQAECNPLGLELLREAHSIFQRLGAKRDVSLIADALEVT